MGGKSLKNSLGLLINGCVYISHDGARDNVDAPAHIQLFREFYQKIFG